MSVLTEEIAFNAKGAEDTREVAKGFYLPVLCMPFATFALRG
jgi:indole-3-glycerol phosphate synthase